MYNEIKIKSKIVGSYSAFFIDEIKPLINNLSDEKKNIFIIDENVFKLYKNKFGIKLQASQYVLIKPSEKNKTVDYSQEVIKKLLSLDIRKNSTLIAVGGGITQDIVAFISSIIFRGIDWVFIPTTLLAQCDSCIGSKSSINFLSYKNLLGTFKPPKEIFIYFDFLNSLSEKEIRSGIGEMLHYFFTDGINYSENIVNDIHLILKDRLKLKKYIIESLRIKSITIQKDEFDESIRHIFNYGHTFGHALESITNYDICHGQAVTLGMDLANFISLKLGFIDQKLFIKLNKILNKNKPEFKFKEENINSYLKALSKDKKNEGNLVGCILLKKIGLVEKEFIKNNDWLKKTILQFSKIN